MAARPAPAAPLLAVRGLKLRFDTRRGVVRALDGVSFEVAPGECVGLVGETGCGKSITARAVMGLVPAPGRIEGGEIRLDGRDLMALPAEEWRAVRGSQVAMIFQEPKRALDPTATVGSQIVEAAMLARRIDRAEAKRLALDTLRQVGLADPERIMRTYAFELSGGMAQRAMIAIAVVGGSRLIIADEPTSSLDVSIQAQILRLLQDLRRRLGSALILITHDLGVAAENCDRIVVMYAGQIVEQAPARELFRAPAHPYTERLLRSLPRPGRDALSPIPGTVPDLIDPAPGCRFANRCERAGPDCAATPAMSEIGRRHFVACYRPVRPT
ncbi:MAG: ABC transporter ATP-binding protein [Alphaproteobacteria bacterium]|nr:ABC transporter ATP-binding protein [Alphaproteobacteria bacterium]